jgi:hypothetical protein
MAQSETPVRYGTNGPTAVTQGMERRARFRRWWQKFLTALRQAMSAGVA